MSDTSDPLEILNAIDRERGDSSIGMIQANQVQRLRTEIVALRRTIRLGPDLPALARDEALEEAARICDALYDGYSTANTDQTDPEQVWLDACDRAATAIRALKETP